jgi:hypothetical protein
MITSKDNPIKSIQVFGENYQNVKLIDFIRNLDNTDALNTTSKLNDVESANSNYLLKKKRRKKDEIEKKKFICDICDKGYYSYPAIYTHKRNKHNIIPVTGKQNTFKRRNIFKFNKFPNVEQSKLTEKIITKYLVKLKSMCDNQNSILFNPDFCASMDKGFLKIKDKLENHRDKLNNDTSVIIDDALALYIINFAKIDLSDIYIDQVICYCICLRMYLNIIGWDYIELYYKYGINMDIDNQKSFTATSDCKYIPELINDFVSVFMRIDNQLLIEEKILLDITRNFCNWLFINNLTNFKLVDNE